MDVAVICVNYRTEHLLPALMDDVRQLGKTGLRVATTIVDCSGTAPGGPDLDARMLDPGENLGFGQGVNLAVRHAGDADVILLVNPDVRFDSDAVAQLIRAVADGSAVAATGRLRDRDGGLQRNTAPAPTLRQLALEYLLGWDARDAPTHERRAVGVMAGSLMAIHRGAFLQVGGFDPRYPLYMEDVDLSLRLGAIGPLVQLPVECGSHLGGASAESEPRSTTVLLHATRVAFFRRQGARRGRVARGIVLGGLALRRVLGRALPLADVVAATRPGVDLTDLLPRRGSAGAK